MNLETIFSKLESIEQDSVIQNLIAQADARYILFNTAENKENFPPYTISDEKLNILAFQYLNIGCQLIENGHISNGANPLEKGARILENVHASPEVSTKLENYFGLISAMAYYACFQYSKSFILINKVASNTIIATLISLFLNRKYDELLKLINLLIVDDKYSDDFIADDYRNEESSSKIYEIIIAKSLNNFVRYFYSGEEKLLESARSNLTNLKEIAEIRGEPDIWWVVRLLVFITDGFAESSLWSVLGNHFNTNDGLVYRYVQALTHKRDGGVYELFKPQRNSISKITNKENSGCIVSIPTSSGKTRIAEIAIIDCIMEDENNKVLFIAPFRSLAYEIENSLDEIFNPIGKSVSHLYGGSLFSKLDEKLIDESNVIVVTPEKAKALLRSNDEILNQIKLVVIDEGHLFGGNKRLIVNEVFYEELRYYINRNGGKFLLLSAVLPNPDDLAQWLTNSREAVFKDDWRPADERLGILNWSGKAVSLNWTSSDTERNSFNPRFIVSEKQPLKPKQRRIRYFPETKNQAVASTAYKLRKFGPVLIFVGLKSSVFTIAREYEKCLNENQDFIYSDKNNWKAFELACIESYGADSEWLLFAKKGILCHNAELLADVRLPLERLMRSEKPLVIIATSTLGQGVNLGVSTVIFSTLYQAGELITSRDFWNIAGRAGRAFVDHEGKILVALETVGKSSLKIRKETKTIKSFFDKTKIDKATSGCLKLIKLLKSSAIENNSSFELLIELLANNEISKIFNKPDELKEVNDVLDWIDDGLLALHLLNNDNNDFEWIDDYFRNSLMYIQALHDKEVSGDEVVEFIKARAKGIVRKVGEDQNKWKSIIKSGIPLNSDLQIDALMPDILENIHSYLLEEPSIINKIKMLKSIEGLINGINVLSEEYLESKDSDNIRRSWLMAVPLSDIAILENATEIITKHYSFNLPWVLNGISKKLRLMGLVDESEILEELSILVELGLPNLKAVKIYQAGIRSRSSALEIADLFEDELWEKSAKSYKDDLLENAGFYKVILSENASHWIDLLSKFSRREFSIVKRIPNFTLGATHKEIERLIAKEIDGKQYLMSPDFSFISEIDSPEDMDFSSVNDLNGVFFDYNKKDEVWEMVNQNPYLKFN